MKPWELLARRMLVLVRDVVWAGFGLFLIYHETVSPGRNALAILGIGWALTGPTAFAYAKAILPGSLSAAASAPPSSPESSEPPGSLPSSTAPGASGERD